MTKNTLNTRSADMSPNPAAEARQLLDANRPRAWRWDDDGNDVAGTLRGVRRMADRFAEGATVLVLELELVDTPERVLVYCSRPLERMLAGHGPRMGDGIAIRRGELVERKDAPTYRAWTVEVVAADGRELLTDQPADPDEPWHLEHVA